VDLVEGVEVRETARIGDRDEAVELPEVLHREGDALLVREAPEDVGGDRAAEMGVQLGEAFHGGSLEGAALPLAYDERVRALVLVVVALAATGAANAAVPPPPEPVQTGFNVPSRNIVCNAGPSRGGYGVVCTVFSEANARGQKIWSM